MHTRLHRSDDMNPQAAHSVACLPQPTLELLTPHGSMPDTRLNTLTKLICGYQGCSHNAPPIPFRAPSRLRTRWTLN